MTRSESGQNKGKPNWKRQKRDGRKRAISQAQRMQVGENRQTGANKQASWAATVPLPYVYIWNQAIPHASAGHHDPARSDTSTSAPSSLATWGRDPRETQRAAIMLESR